MYLIKKIRHLIYYNNKLFITNDLNKYKLKGNVKSITSNAIIEIENTNDSIWTRELIDYNTFDISFNYMGYIIQKIDFYKSRISLFTYNKLNHCVEVNEFNLKNEFYFGYRYRYLYSKNCISKYKSTLSSEGFRKINDYIFNDRNELTEINLYKPESYSYLIRLASIIKIKNNNRLEIINNPNSFLKNECKYYYDDDDLIIKSEIYDTRGALISYKEYFYNAEKSLVKKTWIRNNETLFTENYFNHDKNGNWTEKEIIFSVNSKIRVKRKIDYFDFRKNTYKSKFDKPFPYF